MLVIQINDFRNTLKLEYEEILALFKPQVEKIISNESENLQKNIDFHINLIKNNPKTIKEYLNSINSLSKLENLLENEFNPIFQELKFLKNISKNVKIGIFLKLILYLLLNLVISENQINNLTMLSQILKKIPKDLKISKEKLLENKDQLALTLIGIYFV